MKKLLTFLALLPVFALGLLLASLNVEPVQVHYYIGNSELPLAVVAGGALAIGVAVGVLASVALLLGQKRETARLRRRFELCEQEIRNLRQIPIQDKH